MPTVRSLSEKLGTPTVGPSAFSKTKMKMSKPKPKMFHEASPRLLSPLFERGRLEFGLLPSLPGAFGAETTLKNVQASDCSNRAV
ncbi:hypothetical protein L596_013079 [Steinernema carpocapsae]|uniref:Uncharacterized protein n=1 Tax=Steinernema carpocapsae TaxID=34508 RepID=A0A4U5NZ10_STECR|nr:hypothetical protein L596_013079 [Steinernema carpocapsae]